MTEDGRGSPGHPRSTPRVRRASLDDVAAVRSIGARAWPPTYLPFTSQTFVDDGLATWWSSEAVARSITSSTTFVAELDGTVVGTATVGELDGAPVLWKLYVLPEMQRRGAGAALLDAAFACAGGSDLLVEVTAGNEPALRFYERAGFHREREESGAHGTVTVWLRHPTARRT